MLRRARRRDEGGFTLLEVVVAMFVFAILAASSLALVTRTAQVANNNIRRTTAANLVAAQIEQVRGMAVTDIPDGVTVSYAPANPNAAATDRFFTITQTSSFVPSTTVATVCADSGNTLAYKRVTVQVTWPGMGTTQPVRADTLRAVGVGSDGLDQTKGSLAVSVVNSAGGPTVGVSITVTRGTTSATQVTGDDGCVIFTGLDPGTYTATASTAGFVGTQNTQTVTKNSMGVTAGTISRGSLLVDVARSAVVKLGTTVAGPVVPAGLPLSYRSTYVPTAVTAPGCASSPTVGCADAVPGTIRNFFPESYTLKVGSCAETDASTVGADLRAASSEGSTITVPMGVITVDVKDVVTGQSIIGRTVTFTHAAQVATGCTGGETWSAATTTSGGTPVALPYGSWQVSTTSPDTSLLGQVLTLSSPITLSSTARSGTATLKAAS